MANDEGERTIWTPGASRGNGATGGENGGRLNEEEIEKKFNELSARAIRAIAADPLHLWGGDRDYTEEFGYIEDPDFEDYNRWYERGFGGTIVDIPSEEMWRKHPHVVEVDDSDEALEGTEFNQAFRAVQKEHGLWATLKQADSKSRIGRYGVLLLGLADVNSDEGLSEPVEPQSLDGPDDLLYIRPYHEGNAEVTEVVEDPSNERFGKPKEYEIDQQLPSDQDDIGTLTVHHSRVVHIVDEPVYSVWTGRPDLQRCINNLIDLKKIVGAAGEGIYQLGSPRWHFDYPVDKDLQDSEEDVESKIRDFLFRFKEWIVTSGADIESKGGEEIDPSGAYDVTMQMISAITRYPKTILIGHQMGERASTENRRGFDSKMESRQVNIAEPRIVRPVISPLQEYGILPNTEYKVDWPELSKLSRKEQAEVHKIEANAKKTIAPGKQTDSIFDESELRETVGEEPTPPSERDGGAAASNEDFQEAEDSIGLPAAWNQELSSGDFVRTPYKTHPVGVVSSEPKTSDFRFPVADGEGDANTVKVSASPERPAYIVGFGGRSAVYRESDLAPVEIQDTAEISKQSATDGDAVRGTDDKGNERRAVVSHVDLDRSDWPKGWSRNTVLSFWWSTGGTFEEFERAVQDDLGFAKEFAAELKSQILGTDRWRNRF